MATVVSMLEHGKEEMLMDMVYWHSKTLLDMKAIGLRENIMDKEHFWHPMEPSIKEDGSQENTTEWALLSGLMDQFIEASGKTVEKTETENL